MLRRFLSAVAAPTAVRTFHATPVALASGFTVFVQQVYKNPAQKKQLSAIMPVTKRGQLLGEWYRALSAGDKATLAKTAKTLPSVKKSTKKSRFFARQLTSKAIKALPKDEQATAIHRNWKKTSFYGRKKISLKSRSPN